MATYTWALPAGQSGLFVDTSNLDQAAPDPDPTSDSGGNQDDDAGVYTFSGPYNQVTLDGTSDPVDVTADTMTITGSVSLGAGLTFGVNGTVDIGASGLLQVPGLVLGTADVTGALINIEADGTLQSVGPALAGGDLSIHIGSGGSSQAAIDVSGAGASLDSGGWSVLVGEYGSGTLTIEDGAHGSDGALDPTSPYSTRIAGDAGSGGTLTVTGVGSTYTVTRALAVGAGGSGELTLSDGGTVDVIGTAAAGTANVDIGVSYNSIGLVTVGSGAVLNVGVAGLIVGDEGSGTLLVQGGTVLTSASGYTDHEAALIIDNSYEGSGSVVIDGAGSTIAADGAVLVGESRDGDLIVSDGGVLSAGGANDAGTGLVVDINGGDGGGDVGVLSINDGTVTVTDNALVGSNGSLELGLGTGLAGEHSVISVGGTLTIAENAILTSTGHADSIAGAVADDGTISVYQNLAIAGALSVGQPGTEAGQVAVENGVLTVSGNADINTGGSMLLGGTSTVSVAGRFTVGAGAFIGDDGGYGTIAGPVLVDGTIEVSVGDIEVTGPVTGSGTLGLDGGRTLRLDGTVAASLTVLFAAGGYPYAGEILSLGSPLAMDGTIDGFASGDSIGFTTDADSISSGFSGDTMIITGDGATLAELTFAPGYDATNTFAYDQQGAVSIYTTNDGFGSPPCFVSGTRIGTARGEVAVEQLRIGDLVGTAGGALRPVRWIGHRSLQPADADQFPVRIAAGAFGAAPRRDLYVSGDHCVLCDTVLVPVKTLVNGVTIARVRQQQVTYWHVELETHDVLLAEGLPVESYLDTGNRHAFSNGAVVALRPDFSPGPVAAVPCRPIRTDGPAVVAAKTVLLGALAWTEEPDVTLSGERPDRYGDWLGFIVPPGQLRLRSRSAVAAEAWPASFDPRRLGVAVTEIHVDGRPIALDDPRLGTGWHEPEAGVRWTNGDAALDFPGAVHLDVRLVRGAMRYPAEADDAAMLAASG